MTPKVTKMVVSTGPQRKKPRAGDRKTVGGKVFERRQAYSPTYRAYLVRNGRPVWEWVEVKP